jgi:phosphoribosylaminoimidazole-succinocarboxamide synthase
VHGAALLVLGPRRATYVTAHDALDGEHLGLADEHGAAHHVGNVFGAGRDHAASRGIIIADTKFEFGTAADGALLLIDEVMTPDSSRFWPADRYAPGRSQPSFDKQPLRDYLDAEREAGRWNGDAPPPPLPDSVVDATSKRYLEAYRRVTGDELTI